MFLNKFEQILFYDLTHCSHNLPSKGRNIKMTWDTFVRATQLFLLGISSKNQCWKKTKKIWPVWKFFFCLLFLESHLTNKAWHWTVVPFFSKILLYLYLKRACSITSCDRVKISAKLFRAKKALFCYLFSVLDCHILEMVQQFFRPYFFFTMRLKLQLAFKIFRYLRFCLLRQNIGKTELSWNCDFTNILVCLFAMSNTHNFGIWIRVCYFCSNNISTLFSIRHFVWPFWYYYFLCGQSTSQSLL